MSVDKNKLSSLWAIVLAGAASPAWAVFTDISAMFDALRPTAAVDAPELNQVIIAIDALPTQQQKLEALQTLIPSADGSLRVASEGPMRQMESVLYDRLIRIKKDTGLSSGDEIKAQTTDATTEAPATTETTDATTDTTTESAVISSEADDLGLDPDKGVWIQLLGNNTGQHERYGVPGYDADVIGLLIGRDHIFSDSLMIGAAMGYVHADVESRNFSGSFLDVKRFQGTLYAGFTFEDPWFINGSLTLAYNDYDNNRKILIPPVGGVPFVRIAWTDFGAWETYAHLEGGYKWVCGHFHAIPKIMLTFSDFNINGYFERDAFGLDLDVKYEDMTFIPMGLGLKLEYQYEFDEAYVVPEMHAYAFHDFKHNAQNSKALFTSGGYDFLSQGAEPASNSYEVGAGIAVHSDKNMSVTMQYDYAGRRDYQRHNAFIKVRYEWA